MEKNREVAIKALWDFMGTVPGMAKDTGFFVIDEDSNMSWNCAELTDIIIQALSKA